VGEEILFCLFRQVNPDFRSNQHGEYGHGQGDDQDVTAEYLVEQSNFHDFIHSRRKADFRDPVALALEN
jgi:hypothetical protein